MRVYSPWFVEAMQIWNRAIGYEVFVYDRGADPDVLIVSGGGHPRWWGMALHNKRFGKLRCGLIIFHNAIGPGRLLPTSTHEFGHVLGLSHDYARDKPSVMVQGDSTSTKPTKADIRAIRRLYKEELKAMPRLRPPDGDDRARSSAKRLVLRLRRAWIW